MSSFMEIKFPAAGAHSEEFMGTSTVPEMSVVGQSLNVLLDLDVWTARRGSGTLNVYCDREDLEIMLKLLFEEEALRTCVALDGGKANCALPMASRRILFSEIGAGNHSLEAWLSWRGQPGHLLGPIQRHFWMGKSHSTVTPVEDKSRSPITLYE